MIDEWELVRSYIDGLIERAPTTGPNRQLREQAVQLRQAFAVLEGELAGAKAALEGLTEWEAIRPIVAEHYSRDLRERFQDRWLASFSEAGSLEVLIREATKRGRAKGSSYELDRQLAIHALYQFKIGAASSLRAAILAEAARREVDLTGPHAEQRGDTLYRRIKELIENPLEHVDNVVSSALDSISEKRSKGPKIR